MSEPLNTFGPLQASIRNHLGEIADQWLLAKAKLIRNLGEAIASERDPEKLNQLHELLKSSFISKEDVDAFDTLLTNLLANAKKHATTWVEIKRIFKSDTAKP